MPPKWNCVRVCVWHTLAILSIKRNWGNTLWWCDNINFIYGCPYCTNVIHLGSTLVSWGCGSANNRSTIVVGWRQCEGLEIQVWLVFRVLQKDNIRWGWKMIYFLCDILELLGNSVERVLPYTKSLHTQNWLFNVQGYKIKRFLSSGRDAVVNCRRTASSQKMFHRFEALRCGTFCLLRLLTCCVYSVAGNGEVICRRQSFPQKLSNF